MLTAALSTRSFRNLADDRLELAPTVTIVHGPNGAGKTNVLDALFFGLTGRSCRTRTERELIAFDTELARSEVELVPEGPDDADPFSMLTTISAAEGRRRRVDGRDTTGDDDRRRPAVSVFMPDRLALVKGPPGSRRAHLDRLCAALWPARAEARTAYSRALAQRNALLSRARRGGEGAMLDSWDVELARCAVPLVEARASAAAELAEPFGRFCGELELGGEGTLRYRPRTEGAGEEQIVAELGSRREADLQRGFTVWGPHRDEVELRLGDRPLRRYGSQGQQRIGLLALLFAEREALRLARRTLPLMLLDDVMSELDPERRLLLVDALGDGGQALITTTEAAHVPGAEGVRQLRIDRGAATVEQG